MNIPFFVRPPAASLIERPGRSLVGALLPRLAIVRLAFVLFIGLLAGQSFAQAPAGSDASVQTLNEAPHLEHVGFYASAMTHWNFTEELAPFTNLTWIAVGDRNNVQGGLDELLIRVEQAREAGVGAVLDLEPYLFANEKGIPNDQELITSFLVELRAQLEVRDLMDTVIMLYPKDEPIREFLRERDPGLIEQYVTGSVYAEINADLTLVNAAIKSVFPEKPIGVIYAAYELENEFFDIPGNYDWIGFDCYASLFEGCGERSFVQHYTRLMSKMHPAQRLMAVPEAWATHEQATDPYWAETLRQRLLHHYELVIAEPLFVAFVPFIWSFDAQNETPGIGVDRLGNATDSAGDPNPAAERFRDTLKSIGWQIKHGQVSYPNLDWGETETHPARPIDTFRAGILAVDTNGQAAGFAFSDALRHKNLRVRWSVTDRYGRTVFKSKLSRTHERDDQLRHSIGVDFTGTPGARLQLPEHFVSAYQGLEFNLNLTAYSDGRALQPVAFDTVKFIVGSALDLNPVVPDDQMDAEQVEPRINIPGVNSSSVAAIPPWFALPTSSSGGFSEQ